MLFDPDAIDRLSPSARVEVQEFYARKYLVERVSFIPERRVRKAAMARASQSLTPADPEPLEIDATNVAAPKRPPWPKAWHRNDSSRPPALPREGADRTTTPSRRC
jgi:hypothetical protein